MKSALTLIKAFTKPKHTYIYVNSIIESIKIVTKFK